MTLNTIVIRVSAAIILLTGCLLYIAQSGILQRLGGANAATDTALEETHSSSSRASLNGLMIPEIAQTADVRLPSAAVPVSPEAMVVPASFTREIIEVADIPMTETTPLSDLGLPCTISVSAAAMPAAVVALDVMAPCRGNTEVSIRHSGLSLTAETDALGLLTLDIPAFETPAFFEVGFADGTEETALVDLPDLGGFDRIGLAWIGNMDLELHAMEFGARFGEEGHVWQAAPSHADAAIAGTGGFLTILNAGDSFAQIYTLPRATLREGESVRLSIDAPVTPANCTQTVLARTLRAEGAGPVDVTELSFRVPPCDAVGDVLVLQNLLDDLRLASN